MNEIALSNDLTTIELEISWHKENAGKSIWEIGKRLNHVKENDLVHGDFGKWLEKIEINQRVANQFMKVAKEIPNSNTYSNLGYNALYLIATLPDEQKQEQLERIENGESPTVRELREVKKQLAEKDEQIENLSSVIEDLSAQEPQRIVERVIKEVEPDDYQEMKNMVQTLKIEKSKLNGQIQQLKADRDKQDENSRKYQQLSDAIQEMEGKMNDTQKLIQQQKQVYELVDLSKDLLVKITPIPFLIDPEFVKRNHVAERELKRVAAQTEKFLSNLNEVLSELNIIEGEIINE